MFWSFSTLNSSVSVVLILFLYVVFPQQKVLRLIKQKIAFVLYTRKMIIVYDGCSCLCGVVVNLFKLSLVIDKSIGVHGLQTNQTKSDQIYSLVRFSKSISQKLVSPTKRFQFGSVSVHIWFIFQHNFWTLFFWVEAVLHLTQLCQKNIEFIFNNSVQ